MAPKAAPKAPPTPGKKAPVAPGKKEAGTKGDTGPTEPSATAPISAGGASLPKNKEEVLAQVNLDGLPHCPTDQIIDILRERYEVLTSVFINYCKQSECKTFEMATRLRLGAPCFCLCEAVYTLSASAATLLAAMLALRSRVWAQRPKRSGMCSTPL